jgi:hypothetical protein
MLPSAIKDIERLQRYERIFEWLLKDESFSRQRIDECGESKHLIGRIVNSLLAEGAIKKESRGIYQWKPRFMESYRKEC